ncbi:hypothetical protein GUJ93_ZPchr0010g9371 [Zizania palustris]|uniref:Uncharacterized protein n=1 Tax=Zizania palustris TaxID=103762 RepID=A0A8J5SZ84_ZIZPA|nr:hypothetical protein GUJ93_ZPchr0010g9371 [Zizania palustris]
MPSASNPTPQENSVSTPPVHKTCYSSWEQRLPVPSSRSRAPEQASNTPFEVLVQRCFTAPKTGFARSKSSKPRRLRSTHNPENSALLSQCRLRTQGAFEQASHFIFRKSGLPSEDFDQLC